MTLITTIGDLFESLGAGTADFSQQVANGARIAACKLWESYPDALTNSQLPGISFNRGFYQYLCQDQTLPPPPAPPFEGGQCYKRYYVDCTYKNAYSGQHGGCNTMVVASTRYNAPAYVEGKIIQVGYSFDEALNVVCLRVEYEYLQNGVPVRAFRRLGKVGTGGIIRYSPGCGNKGNTSFGYSIDGEVYSLVITAVDGVDNCGSLPPEYPKVPPPDTYVYNHTVNVDVDTQIDIAFELKNDINNNFALPITFNVAAFGIAVVVAGDGISFDVDVTPPSLPPVGDPPPPLYEPPGGGGGGSPVPTNKNPSPPEEDPDVTPIPEPPPGQELINDEVPGITYLDITLTAIPQNAKVQLGSPGDDIYFPGFVCFRSQGRNLLPRYPLHYVKNRLKAPAGSDGYGIRLYPGFSADIAYYVSTDSP